MKTIRNTLLGFGVALVVLGFYETMQYVNSSNPIKRASAIVAETHIIGHENKASERYFALESLAHSAERLLRDFEIQGDARKALQNAESIARKHRDFAKTNSYDVLPCCVTTNRQ